jgi:hypothetical protein
MRIQQESVRKEDARKAEEARIAAAVEAERKAGEARAAAAVEAERMAEAKRIAEAAKVAEVVAEPEPAKEAKRAVVVESGDVVRAYLNSLDISETERTKLRPFIMGFKQFEASYGMKVAA